MARQGGLTCQKSKRGMPRFRDFRAEVLSNIFGRIIGFLFIGAFCAAGPVLVAIALVSTAQRAWLIVGAERAAGTVIAKQSSPGSSHPSFAPVFQVKANDGQLYTVVSDVSGRESAFSFGQRVPVLYRTSNPAAARIDAFGQLWTLPLVVGSVGAAFSMIPAIVLASWLRRRRGMAPGADASVEGSDGASRGFRGVLGAIFACGGLALLVLAASGRASSDPQSLTESRVLGSLIGILLICSGVLIGQWMPMGSRRQNALGGAAILSMALMFAWVAFFGEASGFRGSIAIGGASFGSSGHVSAARIAFGVGSILMALASLPAWKQVFRSDAPR